MDELVKSKPKIKNEFAISHIMNLSNPKIRKSFTSFYDEHCTSIPTFEIVQDMRYGIESVGKKKASSKYKNWNWNIFAKIKIAVATRHRMRVTIFRLESNSIFPESI